MITRMFDDTNVWVSPQTGRGFQADGTEEPESASEDDLPGLTSNVGKLGRKRVAQLLGLLQTVTVRRTNKLSAADDALETAKVVVPSQVLPKAAQHVYFRANAKVVTICMASGLSLVCRNQGKHSNIAGSNSALDDLWLRGNVPFPRRSRAPCHYERGANPDSHQLQFPQHEVACD